jgi:hypothetical protein
MMRIIVLALSVIGAAAAIRGTGHKTELSTDMRPEVVSKLLSQVTEQWTMEFVSTLSNSTNEPEAYSKMEKSCLTVSRSIIEGSDGDEDRVAEYMQEVCSRSSNKMCASFAKGMDDAMIGDANFNRNSLKLAQFCKTYWNADVKTAAQAKMEQMKADEKAAADLRAAEEKEAAEKKAAEEKAAAEKKAEEEKAAAEKKAADEKAAEEKAAADKKAAAEAAEKAAVEKKATEEKAAAEAEKKQENDRAAAEKLRGALQKRIASSMAAIEKRQLAAEQTFNTTEEDVQKTIEHAEKAMKLATKKEAEAKVSVAPPKKNVTNVTNVTVPAQNETMPAEISAEVAEMVNMNLSKAENAAKAAGEAKADAIIAKAQKKA